METPLLQLIAYVSLTLASITVAGASLFVAYRQNFGWPPTIIVTKRGDEILNQSTHATFIGFELWNRRKYPILLRAAKLYFDRKPYWEGLGEKMFTVDWRASGECSASFDKFYDEPLLLQPNSHHAFEASAPIRNNEDSLTTLKIEVIYFDPTSDRHATIVTDGKFRKMREQ